MNYFHHLGAVVFGTIVLIVGQPAAADEPDIRLTNDKLTGLLKACSNRPENAYRDPKCVSALFEQPELAEMMRRIPALQDGRLSEARLVRQAQASDVSNPNYSWSANRDVISGDPNQEAAEGVYEPDGRTLARIPDEILRQLQANPMPEFDLVEPNRFIGSPELQNLPARQPPEGFAIPGPGFFVPITFPSQLDVLGFLDDVHAALGPNVNGYALEMRSNGQTIGLLQWGWARNPDVGDQPALGWNSNRRMHVASIAKFMTAVALAHQFENTQDLDSTDPIMPWLPDYWDKNAGVNANVTFAHLLNHFSGYSTGNASDTDWAVMKSQVENGANPMIFNTGDYENLNFGLIRIMIATIGGYIDPSFDAGSESLNDFIWDLISMAAYEDYLRTYVFNPVGASPTLTRNDQTVLAYDFATSGPGGELLEPGLSTSDMFCCAGGIGWHMTIDEILDITRSFRQGLIVSQANAQQLLNQSWGLNSPFNGVSTPAGPLYWKPGAWIQNQQEEQAVLLVAPNNMEIVVFVNSPVSAQNTSLQGLMTTLFQNNITGP